ncbi:MAG: IrrE N-terminal-like domain, partial [Thermoleophilaceae bacterium]|nr:IrrE N-terminal-like domain [Thermoleophilaceae bacterium]
IEIVADRLGIQLFPNPSLRAEGRLGFASFGPVIEFNSDRPRTRQAFIKAHELGHWWLSQSLTPRTQQLHHAFSSEEECCDTLAAALLVPRKWVDGRVAPTEQNMRTLSTWAAEAGVSREVMVIRFRELFDWSKILLVWEYGKRWRFVREAGVRPWEYGRIRPSEQIARYCMPEAASRVDAVPPQPVELSIDGAQHVKIAELTADRHTGYCLIDNPFLVNGSPRHVKLTRQRASIAA